MISWNTFYSIPHRGRGIYCDNKEVGIRYQYFEYIDCRSCFQQQFKQHEMFKLIPHALKLLAVYDCEGADYYKIMMPDDKLMMNNHGHSVCRCDFQFELPKQYMSLIDFVNDDLLNYKLFVKFCTELKEIFDSFNTNNIVGASVEPKNILVDTETNEILLTSCFGNFYAADKIKNSRGDDDGVFNFYDFNKFVKNIDRETYVDSAKKYNDICLIKFMTYLCTFVKCENSDESTLDVYKMLSELML